MNSPANGKLHLMTNHMPLPASVDHTQDWNTSRGLCFCTLDSVWYSFKLDGVQFCLCWVNFVAVQWQFVVASKWVSRIERQPNTFLGRFFTGQPTVSVNWRTEWFVDIRMINLMKIGSEKGKRKKVVTNLTVHVPQMQKVTEALGRQSKTVLIRCSQISDLLSASTTNEDVDIYDDDDVVDVDVDVLRHRGTWSAGVDSDRHEFGRQSFHEEAAADW